ncbi:aldo/keto reductase [Sphingomonadaceae bacterium jetA1]|uniref:aldo/keto reductase n=1 Tax=Facivitalis istanbulensis TaxID=3075838 RepID=UPI003479609A
MVFQAVFPVLLATAPLSAAPEQEVDPGTVDPADAIDCRLDVETYGALTMALDGEDGVATGVVPAVNQIELHPRFQQREARAYHARKGIVTQSWSPLGRGGDLLQRPEIVRIADKHGRSTAQVVLAWHLGHGLSVIPKAADAAHMTDNLAATELTLDDADMAAIDALDAADGRIGSDPRTM